MLSDDEINKLFEARYEGVFTCEPAKRYQSIGKHISDFVKSHPETKLSIVAVPHERSPYYQVQVGYTDPDLSCLTYNAISCHSIDDALCIAINKWSNDERSRAKDRERDHQPAASEGHDGGVADGAGTPGVAGPNSDVWRQGGVC